MVVYLDDEGFFLVVDFIVVIKNIFYDKFLWLLINIFYLEGYLFLDIYKIVVDNIILEVIIN